MIRKAGLATEISVTGMKIFSFETNPENLSCDLHKIYPGTEQSTAIAIKFDNQTFIQSFAFHQQSHINENCKKCYL